MSLADRTMYIYMPVNFHIEPDLHPDPDTGLQSLLPGLLHCPQPLTYQDNTPHHQLFFLEGARNSKTWISPQGEKFVSVYMFSKETMLSLTAMFCYLLPLIF
jgi:hypothetical protein